MTYEQFVLLFPQFKDAERASVEAMLLQAEDWATGRCREPILVTIGFYTAYLLSSTGLAGAEVTSKKVGDVAVTFKGTSTDTYLRTAHELCGCSVFIGLA